MPAHLEGAEDGYEGGLGLGHFHAAIGVAVLPDQHRRAYSPLPCVVVRRHLLAKSVFKQIKQMLKRFQTNNANAGSQPLTAVG